MSVIYTNRAYLQIQVSNLIAYFTKLLGLINIDFGVVA
jgi:hypothetical protein